MSAAAQKRQRKLIYWLGRIGLQALVLGLSIIFVLPFVWMLSTSFKTDTQVYQIPPTWVPNPFRWDNYPEALTYVPFGLYFFNTMRYCVFSTVGAVASSALCAYGFSKINWRGRDTVFFILLATLMIPFQVQMIPLYLIFHKLDWLNTYLPLIVPSYLGSAYFVFMLRQFFLTIPMELSDAARIDGASEGQILLHIILPLAKPALTVVGLFQFMGAWNDYTAPLIYLRDTEKFPIALGLQQMRLNSLDTGIIPLVWPHLMAASAVVILPVVFLYFFAQRTFVEGITVTGVKG
ncbi:MAG: carbohydrate ABC transporter permease [Chloroflexi bacterium]|nr:carbohydrate ABC transporter permease [Chloroflexota bacterium]